MLNSLLCLLLCHFNIVKGREETGICIRVEFAYAVPLTGHREVCAYCHFLYFCLYYFSAAGFGYKRGFS